MAKQTEPELMAYHANLQNYSNKAQYTKKRKMQYA